MKMIVAMMMMASAESAKAYTVDRELLKFMNKCEVNECFASQNFEKSCGAKENDLNDSVVEIMTIEYPSGRKCVCPCEREEANKVSRVLSGTGSADVGGLFLA